MFGAYYASRHDYGHYRSCAVTGIYQFPSNLSDSTRFVETLQYALTKTVERHPELCYGIVNKSKDEPAHLYRLPELRWDDIVEIKNDLIEDGDAVLEDTAGSIHDRLFTNQYTRPAWSLVVLRYTDQPNLSTIRTDIIFASHHGISDGSSCLAFHKTLQSHLRTGSQLSNEDRRSRWPYQVADDISKPIFLEDKFSLTKFLDLPAKTKQSDPSFDPWTASAPILDSIDSLRTKAASLSIPFTQVTNILAYCRQRSITLTGLVHGLILIHLSKAVPHAQTFRGTTPVSLRAFTKTSPDEIVNHVSSVYHNWSPEHISIFRRVEEKSTEEDLTITTVAQIYQETVRAEMRDIPIHGPETVVFAAKVKDFDEFCEQSMKITKRSTTYEISNIGLLKAAELEEEKRVDVVNLEKLIFSQSTMVTGCPINCNVVSIAHGPLTITLTWQDGTLEAEIMYGLRDFLKRRLLQTLPNQA